jgi:hypothetical protein
MTSEDARARAEEEAKTQQQKDDAEARYGGMFGRARYNRDKNRLTKRGDKMHPDDKAYIERAQAGYEQMDKN